MAAVTLEQAKNFVQMDYDPFVIDTFREVSPLMNLMAFDTAVNPAGGGGTLTYGYHRIKTPSAAAFRALNTEYTTDAATTEQKSVNLVPLGGAFEIDRVIAAIGSARANEVKFQMEQKIKAAARTFINSVINGDTGTDSNGFDGLSKALTDSETELKDTEYDWSKHDQDSAFAVLDAIDELTGQLDGPASCLIGNSKVINQVRAAARRTNAYVAAPTGLVGANGRDVFRETVNGITIIDAGYNTENKDVVGIESGVTSLYAVRLGMDGFHGVTTTNNNGLVRTWLPDFSTAGAVKRGEVEMGPVAVALKTQRAAAVLRKVRVAPAG